MEEVAKLFYGISGIFGILIAEFMRFGDMFFYYPLFIAKNSQIGTCY